MHSTLPTTPGALLGYTRHGNPIHLIGGGSQPIDPPAPTDPPTPPAPPGPPAAPSPTPPVPTPPTEDLASLPEWAQKALRDARADAGKARTTAKQTAADEARTELAKQVAKALGIQTGDEPPDPQALIEQAELAQNAAWRSGVELHVFRTAGRLGANAEAMLDSLSFIDSLDDLVDIDPSSPDFAAQLEAKVTAAMERNPAFKAGQAPATPSVPGAPQPDPSQGNRGGAQPRFSGNLTDAIAQHYAGLQRK